MTTSPDDRSPVMTTFVVPTVHARRVAEFLTGLGLTVGAHPHRPGETIAIPSQELIDAMADTSGRYRVQYDGEFGSTPRVIDLEAKADLRAAPWSPALDVMDSHSREMLGDRLVPVAGVLDLTVVEAWAGDCPACAHPEVHIAAPYVDAGRTAQRLITFCTAEDAEGHCGCRLALA